MEEKSLTERFPYLFKLESGDLQWYESMGFIEVSYLDTVSDELLKAAGVYVKRTLEDADEDNFTARTTDFMFGATWYFTNFHILKKLPIEQSENAIIIAQIKYAQKDSEDVLCDDTWALSDAYDFIYTTKSYFLEGVVWAQNNITK